MAAMLVSLWVSCAVASAPGLFTEVCATCSRASPWNIFDGEALGLRAASRFSAALERGSSSQCLAPHLCGGGLLMTSGALTALVAAAGVRSAARTASTDRIENTYSCERR